MEDSLSIIFAMIVALLLMFLFPLIDTWELQDNLSYAVVYAATTDFVDTIRNVGYITEDAYNNYTSALATTGNTYEVTMEHRRFNNDLKAYLYTYTNEILDEIYNDTDGDGKFSYKLDKFDYFYVTVKNTNRTQATILSDFFAGSSATNFKIGCSYGGVVWSVRDEM